MSNEKPIITIENAEAWIEIAVRCIDKAKARQEEYNRCIAKMEQTELQNAVIMEDNYSRLATQDARLKSKNRITYFTWFVEFSLLAYIAWQVST